MQKRPFIVPNFDKKSKPFSEKRSVFHLPCTKCQRIFPRSGHNSIDLVKGGEKGMSQSGNSSGNRVNVPEAKGALDNMKFEIARELGINFKQGYNGDLSSRENGYVGGYMVKRLIEQAEKQMAGKQ